MDSFICESRSTHDQSTLILAQASSGKDRRICIWRRGISDDKTKYELCAATDSAHKRIVWSVHYSPSNSNILASASRDGFVKVWRVTESGDDSTTTMNEMFR
jgi:WD40 repeat protein